MLDPIPTPVDPDDLRTTLGELVVTSHRLIRLAAQATGSAEASATWAALSALDSYGPLRLGELAKRSRVAQPTMTKMVQGLTQSGWVSRTAHEDDARASVIAITSSGEAALDSWRKALADALVPLFNSLSVGDFDALKRSVTLLSDRVDVTHDPRPVGH